MSIAKPIHDEMLAALDKSAEIGDRLPEEGSVHWLALRERLRLAEGAVKTWKAVALERQSIKADYARLWYGLGNFLSAFDGYFEFRGRMPSPEKVNDAKQAMFSAAIQARESLERVVTRPDGTTSVLTPGPASPDDSAPFARTESEALDSCCTKREPVQPPSDEGCDG